MKPEERSTWQRINFQDFWSGVAPHDHVLQVYDNERIFLNTLEGFIGSGLLAGDTVVTICTALHLATMRARLERHEIDVEAMIASGRYVPLQAHEMLSRFMVNGMPEESAFMHTMDAIYRAGVPGKRRIRAFGEMVAVLWEEGSYDAAIAVEHLWNKFCRTHAFCLFCAYSRSGVGHSNCEAEAHLCGAHSKIIGGWDHPCTEINFRSNTTD
jgi:hypothetical protein